jgi:hypothetical protein
VPVNPVDYVFPRDISIREIQEIVADRAAMGVRDSESQSSVLGKQRGEGDITISLDPTLAGYFIKAALGTEASPTSEGSGVYTHNFTVNAANTPTTLSLIFDRAGIDRKLFPYATVSKLEIAVAEGGEATMKATIVSRAPVTSVSGSLTTVSGKFLTWRDAQMRFGTTVTVADAAAATAIKEFSVTIDNGSQPNYQTGNGDPDNIAHKDLKVSGKVSLFFENSTELNNYLAATKRAATMTLWGRGIGGGFTEFVKIRLYKFRWEDFPVQTPLDDYLMVEGSFTGEYSLDDSKTIDVQLRNRKSSSY